MSNFCLTGGSGLCFTDCHSVYLFSLSLYTLLFIKRGRGDVYLFLALSSLL